jgi:hypothetical protein
MPESLARLVSLAVLAYLAVGVPFALLFAVRGVARIDPVARESTRGFRVLLVPGAVALWPLLLVRWVGGRAAPDERNAHRDAARGNAR